MAQNEYYLMHHGVKGMKWGVRRTPAQLGHRPTAGSRIKTKLNDPEFKRKAAKAAKIALVVGAAYATHKVVNDPKVLAAGQKVFSEAMAKSGTIKASVINSTEFKAAIAAGKAGKKALKFVSSEDVRKTVAGVGAMATTAGILRGQIKSLKEKPQGDAFDKAVTYTKKASDIGQSINTLAKGPKGNSSTQSSGNSSSSNADSSGKPKTTFTDKGGQTTFSANKHLDANDLKTLKNYKINHPGMTTKEALDELGWLDKETTITHDSKGRVASYRGTINVKHSDTSSWSFNSMVGCRYIF